MSRDEDPMYSNPNPEIEGRTQACFASCQQSLTVQNGDMHARLVFIYTGSLNAYFYANANCIHNSSRTEIIKACGRTPKRSEKVCKITYAEQ